MFKMSTFVIIALSALFVLPTFAVENIYGNCISTTDAVYALPDTPLSDLNPLLATDPDFQALVAAGCPPDRKETAACPDKPSIGSGLAQLSKNRFLGITDNGLSNGCGSKGKAFLVPKFAPSIVQFKVDSSSNLLKIRNSVPLLGTDLVPVSGISNGPADETPFRADCRKRLPYDPSGLDLGDIALIPKTDFVAIVEEYSPSVVLANYETGEIIARHVPASIAPVLAKARYPIVGDIPDVYANRRQNRGFEAVVVDKRRRYVIAILQSPMLGKDESKTIDNSIIRCAYFKLSVSKRGIPSLRYKRSFVIESSPPAAYENNNAQNIIKYSGAQYYARDQFVALERGDGQVKLFLVDFSKATNIDDTKYADNLGLEMDTNGVLKAAQVGVTSADKTLIWDSAAVVGGSEGFTGSFKQEGFVIDRRDKTKVWMIDDNDFGLGGKENIEMRKISLGRSANGATVCQLPEHPPSPSIKVIPSKAIKLKNAQTYRISDKPGAGAAENFDVDEEALRAYVANDDTSAADSYDVSTSPATPVTSYIAGRRFKPTSASVCKTSNMIAVAFANDVNEDLPGLIDILSKDLKLIRRIKEKCIGPDHVIWSDDCKFLVAACEGEGANVPGGILVADFGGPPDSPFRCVSVATFKRYDRIVKILVENGIRLVESQKPSVDLEPEFVTIKGRNAFVTIQEANAIAVVDLYEAKITELKPIGFIDRSRPGFALDASDQDNRINIRNYPFLFGMPQPDSISNYVAADGETYLVFANEGDAKDDVEEARGADITDPDELDRNAVGGLKELVEDSALLGRLKFSTIMGYNKLTNTQEKIFHFGSRSFSIMSLNGTVVFDSGEWFARIQEELFPAIFNANGFDDDDLSASQADLFDNR